MRALLPLLLAAACTESKPAASEARRVVSLLPSFTEIVVELEAQGRLVGCTRHCKPGREVVRVPWTDASAVEAILRTRPDLVLRQAPRKEEDPLASALERAGVKVLSLPSETISNVRGAILAIGDALGIAAAATAFLEEFDNELVRASAGAVGKPRPTVLFVYGRDPDAVANITAAGPGSFLDEMITRAGGRNVLADVASPYPSIALESLVRRRPQVIIDNLPGSSAAWDRFHTVPAVKNHRVHVVADPGLLIPGPRLPAALARLVDLIHGRP